MLTDIILGKKLVKIKDKKKLNTKQILCSEHSHDMSNVRAENADKQTIKGANKSVTLKEDPIGVKSNF